MNDLPAVTSCQELIHLGHNKQGGRELEIKERSGTERKESYSADLTRPELPLIKFPLVEVNLGRTTSPQRANEYEPFSSARNGQNVPQEIGLAALKVFKEFKHETWLLNDLEHYQEMDERQQ